MVSVGEHWRGYRTFLAFYVVSRLLHVRQGQTSIICIRTTQHQPLHARVSSLLSPNTILRYSSKRWRHKPSHYGPTVSFTCDESKTALPVLYAHRQHGPCQYYGNTYTVLPLEYLTASYLKGQILCVMYSAGSNT